jgi:upstream activation factor subunit UAF30
MEDPVDDLFDMDDENDPQPMKEAKKEDEVYKDEHFSDLDEDFFGDENEADAQKDTADHEKIQQTVSEILKNSNINELSIKDIKEQLSSKYEIDIKKNKQFIRETIEKQLADSEVPVEADGDDGELDAATGKRNTTAVTAKKRQSVFSKPALLSPALAEFMGQQLAPRQEVVKFLWKYIKEHELQNPKDKRIVLFDEKLQKIFKKKSSHFMKLTKLLFKVFCFYPLLNGDEDLISR